MMPKYKYLGCGNITTKTSKAGNQYVQRAVYVAPIKDDGSTASATNVYLMGTSCDQFDPSTVPIGAEVFLDFNHKGWLQDMRVFRPEDKDKIAH